MIEHMLTEWSKRTKRGTTTLMSLQTSENTAMPAARIFEDSSAWIRGITRAWQLLPPVDMEAAITPNEVEAASGHTFVITLTVGAGLVLPAGAHITVEVPECWDCHLGNCFRRGVHTLGNRDQVRAGYGAYVDVECSNPAVQLAHAASWGRHLDLLDIAVQAGTLQPGDEVRVIIGPPDGNLLQAQKFAQTAVFSIGVDADGSGEYRQIAAFPTVNVVGAQEADRFRVFAPAVVQPGEAFNVRVLPVDIYSFNPATNYAGEAQVFASDGLEIAERLRFDGTGEQPAGECLTATAKTSGVHTLSVFDPKTGISGKSNPIGVGFLPEGGIYFGEMHSQMWLSMGTGTTAEFFAWGRDAAGLDFCAPANHYNWRYEVTPEIWQDLQDDCNRFNAPGSFVALVSFEWGGIGGSGHKNIYYRGDSGPFHYWYRGQHRNPTALWQDMADKGLEALTVPHHPKAAGGVDWGFRNDRYQRLVEICSKWDIAEEAGPLSVQGALAMGHRLGFVGGTDSHYGLANQGSYHVNDGNGLACVVAPELTREAIWQALYDRRCYATTGDRILLDFTIDGKPMGSDNPADLRSAGPRQVRMRAAGTASFTRVEVIRNNQVVFSADPQQDVWEDEWIDTANLADVAFAPTFPGDRPFVYYYLRVVQANRQRAWSSPIWFTQAE